MKTLLKITSLLFIFNLILSAQAMEDKMFKEVKDKIDETIKEQVNLMSPSNFDNAMSSFKEANEDYRNGANLSDIREELEDVKKYLNSAWKVADIGKVAFSEVLAARTDALNVDAKKNVPQMWSKAEAALREAGLDLEDGDMNDARDGAKKAESLFRAAELEAIKISYLVETRSKIAKAEDNDVTETAPITLALAKKLVNECETELNNNRYDTDKPRSLAKRAQYEIKHALYIDNFVNDFNAKEKTLESLILDVENEFQKIVNAIEIQGDYTSGFAPVADKAAEQITNIRNENVSLNEKVSALEQEVKLLKDELSGLSAEKSELASKMEKLNIIKQKYEKIGKIFNSNEAVVLRKGNDVIIRLVGLSFDVGKSVIKPDHFGLLTKVKKAINEFPNSKISIEGHTDSFGSDKQNLTLSQERADAVTQYLLANMNLDKSKITSTGYGETKPIANNETKEGRAKNRRIDLIIHN